MKVCLSANALDYPTGGGHLWVALNWALGLRALGCEVIWLERAQDLPGPTAAPLEARLVALQNRLAPYGLAAQLAIWPAAGAALPSVVTQSCLSLEAAAEADLLLNFQYFAPSAVIDRFRRSALIDIDPGLLQLWVGEGLIPLARHDQWFTIGETVGQPGARFPDLGLRWQYTPPCVALDWWPTRTAAGGAPFTTLSHWWAGEWLEDAGEVYDNTKRAGFLPFLELPRHTGEVLELALYLEAHEEAERAMLRARGWRVRESAEVSSTPWDYQRYVQGSRGEFSCAKPSCLRLENAWISDRTLCYLASGKPAVVQHTGASRFLPDADGLFRFHDLGGAARALTCIAADYEGQCARARALAEEHFDAHKVVGSVLERALG